MASSKFNESPIREEYFEDNLTVVVADSTDLTFDEEIVENLIESSGANKSVTFVRMENSGSINEPIIMDIIPSDELLEGTEIIELLSDSFIDSETSQIDCSIEASKEETLISTLNLPALKLSPPQRRSQRQIDREMQDEANRIKKENQETLKKEREELQKNPKITSLELKTTEESESKSSDHIGLGPKGRKAKMGLEIDSPSRPKRQRKLPAHLQSTDFEFGLASLLRVDHDSKDIKTMSPEKKDVAKDVKDESKLADEDKMASEKSDSEKGANQTFKENSSDGDWDSEDDPERLWCICNKPHNNKFMISCDGCKDWFHGHCVGITKKMGQDLEEAQATWTCPKCEKSSGSQNENEILTNESNFEAITKKTVSHPVKQKQETESNEKRTKQKNCMECEKNPLPLSIYCSEECIERHVLRVKERFKRVRMTSNLKALAKGDLGAKVDSTKDHLVVVDSLSNTMLSGKNAPTESNLEFWLKNHSSFYVVLPNEVTPKKFYGSKPQHPKATKLTAPHREATKEEKLAQYNAAKNLALSSLQAKKRLLEESGETTTKREVTKRVNSGEKDHSRHLRRSSESSSQTRPLKESPSQAPKSKHDQKPIRENAKKGIREALKQKIMKASDIKINQEDLDKLSEVIEEEMFNLYQRDIGTKYKNKYRSLVFNIRDEKNNGLFRKIINGTFSPRQLVRMTADQMASKELQEWREAELRNDIEKIKSYELDMIALGSQFVMKSHKGEQLIEKDEVTDSTVKSTTSVKLPDDLLPKSEGPGEKSKIGEKTWDHGNHAFLSTCDVCTGKMSLNDFVIAKLERAKKHEEDRRKREKRSKSHDRHRSHDRSKHRSRSKDERKRSSRSRDHHSREKRRSKVNELNEAQSPLLSNKKELLSEHKERHWSKSKKDDRSSHRRGSQYTDMSKSSKDSNSGTTSESKDGHSREKSREKHTSEAMKLSIVPKHHHHKSSNHHKSSSSNIKPEYPAVFKSPESNEKSKIVQERPKTPDIEKPPEVTCEAIQKALNVIQESLSQKLPEVYEESDEVFLPLGDLGHIPSPKIELSDKFEQKDINPDDPYDPSVDISEDILKSPTDNLPSGTKVQRTLSEPFVWKGSLTMEEVSKLSVPLTAYRASGVCDFLEEDFREHLRICGRIQPDQVWDYVGKISENPSKEILVVQFEPSGGINQNSYKDLFNYFKQRNRFGVIALENCGSMLKDFYIIPLEAKEQLHRCVPFEGPGIANDESEVLVGLVVRSRRKRLGDSSKFKKSSAEAKSKPKLITTPPLSYIPTPRSIHAPYDRDLQDLHFIQSRDNEAYDPDSAFPTLETGQPLESNFGDDFLHNRSQQDGSDSSGSDSLLPGLGDLPKGIANILFKSDSRPDSPDKHRDPRKRNPDTIAQIPVSSSLRSISDVELLAIAARQIDDEPTQMHNVQSSTHGSKSSKSCSQMLKSQSRHDSWKERSDPWRPRGRDREFKGGSEWVDNGSHGWDRRNEESTSKQFSRKEKEWGGRR